MGKTKLTNKSCKDDRIIKLIENINKIEEKKGNKNKLWIYSLVKQKKLINIDYTKNNDQLKNFIKSFGKEYDETSETGSSYKDLWYTNIINLLIDKESFKKLGFKSKISHDLFESLEDKIDEKNIITDHKKLSIFLHGLNDLIEDKKFTNKTLISFVEFIINSSQEHIISLIEFLNDTVKCNAYTAVELLLDKYPNIMDNKDSYDRTPLMTACKNGNEDIVELLLNKGAAIDSQNNLGYTALTYSIEYKQSKIVEILINQGADLTIKDRMGNNLLAVAVSNNSYVATEKLIGKKLNVNAKNKDGDTPAMIACKERDIGILNLLLKNKADINLQNNKGETALMNACEKGDIQIVRSLLKNGADIDLVDNNDNTALMIVENKINMILANGLNHMSLINGFMKIQDLLQKELKKQNKDSEPEIEIVTLDQDQPQSDEDQEPDISDEDYQNENIKENHSVYRTVEEFLNEENQASLSHLSWVLNPHAFLHLVNEVKDIIGEEAKIIEGE